jgi:hypothetical protein
MEDNRSIHRKAAIIHSDEIQKLRDRRNSLEQRYHELKSLRENIHDTNPRQPRRKKYSLDPMKKIRRSSSAEPSNRQACATSTTDSTSSHKILIKAISQLLEKKKDMEEQDKYSYSTSSKTEHVDRYIPVSRGRTIHSEMDPMPSRRCRSLDRSDCNKMDDDEVPSTITGRSSNISIHKAITQLLEKKQRIDMSTQDLYGVSVQSKAPSVLLAGFLRKAVPSRVGEWTTIYVQVQPGILSLSDCYGRSKQKIILYSSMFKCRAVKVTDQVMKLLSKAGENVDELSFFETQSKGGPSRLFMTYSSVERDAWLAALQDATMEDESVSDLSTEMEL